MITDFIHPFNNFYQNISVYSIFPTNFKLLFEPFYYYQKYLLFILIPIYNNYILNEHYAYGISNLKFSRIIE